VNDRLGEVGMRVARGDEEDGRPITEGGWKGGGDKGRGGAGRAPHLELLVVAALGVEKVAWVSDAQGGKEEEEEEKGEEEKAECWGEEEKRRWFRQG